MDDFLDDYPAARPVYLSDSCMEKGTKLCVGRLFTIRGSLPPDAQRITFDLYSGGITERNVALHVDIRFGEGSVVRNTHLEGRGWCEEERAGGFPSLARGASFEMTVAVEEGRFRIAFNGSYFADFVHRVPPALVDAVKIHRDVKVTSYQETLAPHTFGLLGDPLHPIQRNNEQQSFEICEGMMPGKKIHIGGVPLGETFVADFKPDITAAGIGLHISCRVAHRGYVVFNSRTSGGWQEEVEPKTMIFVPGEYFDLLITTSECGFSVILNGSSDVNFFPFRDFKGEELKRLVIHGSVKINYVTSIRE